MKFEYGVGHCLFYSESVRVGVVQFHRRPRYYAHITFDFFKKIRKFSGRPRFVRKRALNDHILAGLAQRERSRSTAEIPNRCPVKIVRDGTSEENLVVVLSDPLLIDKNELCDNGAGLRLPQIVQIRNVTYDEIAAVKGKGVALLDKAPHIIVND